MRAPLEINLDDYVFSLFVQETRALVGVKRDDKELEREVMVHLEGAAAYQNGSYTLP